MWSPLKSSAKGEERIDVEAVRAKALYYRQTFSVISK
jgi:hypothetical protein